MATTPVNIRDYQIENLSIAPRDRFDRDPPIVCQIAVRFAVAGHPENENAFKVELHIHIHADRGQPANLPYEISLVLHGFFETPSTVAPDAIPAPLVLNALIILYGVARGYIGAVTASHLHGLFVIPSIVLDATVERAAHTPGSNVIPTPQSIPSADPAAAPAFRFLFSIEDLRRYAELIEDPEQRLGVQDRISALVDALNRFATSPGQSVGDCTTALQTLQHALRDVPRPLSQVLATQVSYITDGLEHAKASRDQESSFVVSSDSRSVHGSGRGKKKKGSSRQR